MSEGKQIRSASVIARLLGAEGFNDHTANCVEKYWKTRSGLTDKQKLRIERLERELTELCAPMTESQRLVLGRFIGLHKKMSFDVGLRIGLQAFAQKQDKVA